MGVVRVVLTTCCAVLLISAPASARIINAEGILPPGQSGFVSLTGLTSGTGSPHAYDQQPLFIDFRRKSFQMNQAGTTELPRAGVKIVRDAFGVPAIYGDTEVDAWWGAGYAVAQDRLFELEAFRHATQGRLAELTGKGALEDDLVSRRDYYTPGELMQMFEELPPTFQRRVEAYRDGINAWIKTMPLDQIPAEYVATATLPTPWRTIDSISIGIFLARTVPSGDGNELRNLRALQDGGPRVLDELLPLSIKRQISTVPRANGLFPQGKRLTAKQASAARKRSLAFADTLPKPPAMATRAKQGIGGSYMFAVRAPGKRALLFNGPQLGFAAPELFVELEVHAPGFDVRGVTAPGVPVIGIGHNNDVAWGFTSGLSDEDDLYAEKVTGRERYEHKGQTREMRCRTETFHYKEGAAALLGGRLPEIGTTKERICRTVHGPVQHVDGNVAYARRYAIWGRELESLIGIDMLNRAKTIRDVDAAARAVTWNENIMAADSAGNIGYWHPGLVQIRPARWDQRLPLPGTGEAEWGGLVPRSRMPRVINPKQGWLANWNNIPSQGWTTGDGEATERVTGQFHRVGLAQPGRAWVARAEGADVRGRQQRGASCRVDRAAAAAGERAAAACRARCFGRGRDRLQGDPRLGRRLRPCRRCGDGRSGRRDVGGVQVAGGEDRGRAVRGRRQALRGQARQQPRVRHHRQGGVRAADAVGRAVPRRRGCGGGGTGETLRVW